jgi:hypothetical protein
MSQDEKDAVIGRIVRERGEVQRNIAALRAEARRFGEMLYKIGQELENYPEHVAFNGVEGNIKHARSASTVFDARDINGNQIVKLVTDLRIALDKLDKLNQEAKSLGIDSN